jgi:hypothetical protein
MLETGEAPTQFGSYRLEEREVEPNRVQQHDMRAAALDLVMERWGNHVILPAKRVVADRQSELAGARQLQSVHNPGGRL